MELSVLIGFGYLKCTNYSDVFIIGVVIRKLWNTLPTSASTDDATTCHIFLRSTNTIPKKMYILCGVLLGDKNLQL